MEELLYWIIEYVKVLFGYGFIMFIWPSAVFRKYLRGKSVTFRFGFCATVPIVLINTVVLMLGLLHILNRWTMWIFFYGLFIWSFREKFKITENTKKKFKYLVTGTFGWKHLLLLTREGIVRFIKRTFRIFWKFYRVHWLEYTLLVITVVYGMVYFSWGAFQEHSYTFSDVYTHHSWIYQLGQGNVFSAGIYPEGMHCVVYSLHALLNLELYSCLLFGPGVNVALVLIAIYCLTKELFEWRYSSIFVLTIFLTLDVVGRYIMIGMARMQCSLPQEFGFPAVFLCTLYLIRYLKNNHHYHGEKERRCYWDENIFLFMMSFSVTIIMHFYATMMAFFLCLGVAICCFKKIFVRERFVPLVVTIMIGLLIAVVPMVIGYATGIPLQGSLNWGLSVIQSSTDTEETVEESEIINNVTDVTNILDNTQTTEPAENNNSVNNESEIQNITQGQEQSSASKTTIFEKMILKIKSCYITAKSYCNILYTNSYFYLYGKSRANIFVVLSIGAIGIWCAHRLFGWLKKSLIKKDVNDKNYFDGYLLIVAMSIIYMIVFAANPLGLPRLIESSRIGFITHLMIVMITAIPLDVMFSLLCKMGVKRILPVLSLITTVCIVAYIYLSGNYHSYLYSELTRFDATVEITKRIMDELPDYSYTIVSPTEELYQVIEDGRHEELLTFLQWQYKEHYTIPTEYVFIFVEKKPLKYAQYHFWAGPEWLAHNKYQEIYGTYSMHPKYLTTEIAEEEADKELQYFKKLSDSYAKPSSRTILQSRAYEWCKKFDELYPHELKKYYEDEYLVCYYFKQNTHRLYNLVVE